MSVFPRQKNYGADLMEIMHGGPRSTATVEESDDQPRVGNALLQAMGRRPSQPAEPTGMPRMNLAASGIESRLGSAGMSMYGQQPPITMPMPAPVQLSPVAQTATPPAPFPQMDMQASGIEQQLQAGGMNLYGRQPLPDPPDMSGPPSKPLQPMTPEERQQARDVARYGPDYASTGDLPPIVGIGHALARTGANIARLPHTLREVAGSVIAESANRAAAGRPYPKVPFGDELADALTGAPRPAPAPIQQAMGMVAEAGQALATGDPMQQAQTGFIDQMRQLPRSQSAEGFQPDKPAWWIENVTEALPYIGMTFATGGIGAASGLGATGSILLATLPTMGVEAQDSLLTITDQLESQGMTRQQAMNAAAPYAAGVGVVAGAFEAVPAAELLTDGPMGRALKQRLAKMVSEHLANVAGRGGATAVAESVTEIGQELTQAVGEFAATGDPSAFDDLDTRLKAAGTIGGVVGGGTGVVTTPVIGQQDRIAPPTSPAAPPTVPTTQPKPDDDTPSTDDIASLKYVQLRERAEAMGLDKRGSHAVLVERIREAQRRSTTSEPQQPPVEPQRAATTEEPTPESFGLSEAARTGYSRFEELRQLMIDNHVRWEDIESSMGRSLDETKPGHQAIAHNYLRRNLNRITTKEPQTPTAETVDPWKMVDDWENAAKAADPGAWDGSVIGATAKRYKLVLNTLKRKPWSKLADMPKAQQSWLRSMRKDVPDAISIRWDREGNPHYAVAGTPSKPGLLDESAISKIETPVTTKEPTNEPKQSEPEPAGAEGQPVTAGEPGGSETDGYELREGKPDRLTIIDESGISPSRLGDAERIIETYSNYRIDVGERTNPDTGSMRAAALDEESIRAVQVARQTIDADRRSRMVEIPSGQADMKLWANKGDESKIRALLKKIESIVKRPQQITRTATTGPKGNFRKPSVAKTDAGIVKAILDGASKENTRWALNGVMVDGENMVVTDGHMLWIAKGEWGKDGFYPRDAIAKDGTLPAVPSTDADLPKLPPWRDVVPTYGANDAIPNVDVLTAMKHIQMAAKMAEAGGELSGVLVVVNDDGTLGYAAYSPEFGTAEINIRDDYEVLGAVNPQLLSKALAFHHIAGDTEVKIAFPYPNKPILIKGDARRATTVIMPVNIAESVEQQAITARPKRDDPADAEPKELADVLPGHIRQRAQAYGINPTGKSNADLKRIIERRPVTEPADTEMQELIYAEFRADEPSKRSTPESFRDEFPEGESSPFEFTLPEGIKLREGIGPDIMEAARMIAVPVKSKKLRGLMLGVFRHPPGMIELRDIRWIRTLAHEAGHAVDFRMNGNSFPSSIRNRFPTLQLKEREAREQLKRASEFIRPLQGMSWSDRSSYVRYRAGHAELMADLICLYQLAPDKARELAPDVTAALEAKIESNPIVKAAMDLVLNPDEAGIKATAKKHIAERTTLPDPEFVDPTNPEPMLRADVLDLVKQTNRELGVHLHRVYSTSRKWREQLNAREREDVAAFVEGISNLSVKGDTFEAVESRMTPAMHAAAREYRYEQELNRQEANRIFHEAGEGPEKIKWIADYLAHFYMAPRAKLIAFLGRWRKQTPHIKKRQFPTLKEAVEAGLVPVSQDIAYLYERAAENNFRAAMTRHFLKQLRAKKTLAGDPVIVGSIEAAGPDWRRIEHPVLRTIYARKNARGETILGENFAYVHPSIERPVQVLLDRQFDGPVARIITAINSAGKALNVAFSFFHEITLYESSSAVNMKFLNPLRGVLIGPFESKRLGIGFRPHLTYRAGLKLDRKDPHGTQDAIRHGLSLTRAASADYARSYLETMLRRVEHVARKVPQLEWLVRRVRKAVESYNRHLWDNAHQGLKLFSYHTLAADILPKLPRGISAREAKETIASYVNDAFGGQEFLELPVLKKGHRAFSEPATVKQVQMLHGLLFAPDWTISNIRIAGRPVVNIGHPLMRRLGVRYWRNMAVTLFGSMAAAQYAIYWALGGDDDDMKAFPWQNEIGRTTSIDVTPLRNRIYTVLGIEPPKERAYIHPGKQAFEVLRYFEQFPEGLVQNIGNKSSVAVRMAVEQMTSHQAGLGFPMPWANDAYGEQINGWAEIVERAKAVGEQFIPFSWQPNNFAFALPKQSGMTKYRAGRHYEDSITAYADPSWWNAIGQSVGLKSQEAAAIDMIAKVHDAAVANGIEPEASRQLFIMAMNRVRGVYYGKFLDAIEDQDWNAADRYAVVLLNLGTEPRQVAASARRRSRSELSAEAESYLRSAGVRDRTLNFDDLVR